MEWTRGPTLGRGSSATVSLATTVTGHLLAVKSTELSTSIFLQKEQQFLSQISSPYIVKYMGCDTTMENNKSMFNIFMEYIPGGTLSDVVRKQGGSLDEYLIRIYSHQILQGLDHLHLNKLVHCDIKGQNVLIGKDGGVKIADLGCARLVEEDGSAATLTFSGTPVFMAPEVARGEDQSFPADIWALGCTIIEMATGTNPWGEVNDPLTALYRIGCSSETPEIPSWLSSEAKDFLSKCLIRDPKGRWTAKQLLQHSFFHHLEAISCPVEEIKRNSPNCVLDKAFWDSLEVPELLSSNVSHVGSSSNYPGDRIRQLVGDGFASDLNFPSWTDDEDWVTVRISETEESFKLSQENMDMDEDDRVFIGRESFMFSFVDEEELEMSVENEDLSLESYVDNSSNIDRPCIRTDIGVSCKSVKIVSASPITKLMNTFLLPNSNCSSIHDCFSFKVPFIYLLNYFDLVGLYIYKVGKNLHHTLNM